MIVTYVLEDLPREAIDCDELYKVVKKHLETFAEKNNPNYPFRVKYKKHEKDLLHERSNYLIKNKNNLEFIAEKLAIACNPNISHTIHVDWACQDLTLNDKAYKRFNKIKNQKESFEEFREKNPRAFFDLSQDIKNKNKIKDPILRACDFKDKYSFIKIYGISNPQKFYEYELNNNLGYLFGCYKNSDSNNFRDEIEMILYEYKSYKEKYFISKDSDILKEDFSLNDIEIFDRFWFFNRYN